MELRESIGDIRIGELCPSYFSVRDNKYSKCIIAAYYSLTRSVTAEVSYNFIANEASYSLLFDEFIRYLAGDTICMEDVDSANNNPLKQFTSPGPATCTPDQFINTLKGLINKMEEQINNITSSELEQKSTA